MRTRKGYEGDRSPTSLHLSGQFVAQVTHKSAHLSRHVPTHWYHRRGASAATFLLFSNLAPPLAPPLAPLRLALQEVQLLHSIGFAATFQLEEFRAQSLRAQGCPLVAMEAYGTERIRIGA
mmetsp:Transcript_20037/g.57240  ORF Transcript_20037/g.57240 Transcript_20037/m.57240 type:complete len:121 (-) Transcript_20037:130-492(-)